MDLEITITSHILLSVHFLEAAFKAFEHQSVKPRQGDLQKCIYEQSQGRCDQQTFLDKKSRGDFLGSVCKVITQDTDNFDEEI